jgi:hypothetical protein
VRGWAGGGQVVQQPGEILFVPSGWHHQVCPNARTAGGLWVVHPAGGGGSEDGGDGAAAADDDDDDDDDDKDDKFTLTMAMRWRQVLNETACLSINHNWFSALAGLRQVWDFLKREAQAVRERLADLRASGFDHHFAEWERQCEVRGLAGGESGKGGREDGSLFAQIVMACQRVRCAEV